MTTAIQNNNTENEFAGVEVHELPLQLPPVPFNVEILQHLTADQALQCQMLLDHGRTLGQWETPKHLCPALRTTERKIDLAARVKAYLPDPLLLNSQLEQVMPYAVLYLTRWALLCRLAPVGFGPNAHSTGLDVSTIAQRLYQLLPQIVAKGIERYLCGKFETLNGFARLLTTEDLQLFYADRFKKNELNRLHRLVAAGLWFDEPNQVPFHLITTPVKGKKHEPSPERKSEAYQPLPDEYMEKIGPRVLWLINDLGPNLIQVLNHLLLVQRERGLRKTKSLSRHLEDYFTGNEWKDRAGNKLEPPFALRLSNIGIAFNPDKTAHAWPPRDFADLMSLSATLQRAHMFMALLMMAARHGEVLTLTRDCVQVDTDGRPRIQGKTYKASSIYEGKDRKWAAPKILIHALTQQIELIKVSEQLDALLKQTIAVRFKSDESVNSFIDDQTHLWGTFGAGGNADATVALNHLGNVLRLLARAIDLDEKPGGINIHPHRLRKTMARLAGIAIEGSQKVLMQLLGHDDVTTTLHYMQSDPAFRQDVEDVIREIRILRMEETIVSARTSMHVADNLPNAGLGGGGATVLTQTIVKHEEWLHRQGREWGAGDARELATLLADNGRAARLIAPGVVCTKSTHERGLCNSRMGEISPGNCKVECHSHIELAVGRRDVQRVIPILVQHTTTSIENGEWLAAIHNRKQLIHEMSRFPDIGDEWRAKTEVQSLLALDLEEGQ